MTVRADDKSRTYGTTNPPFTFTCTGFVNGETAAVLAGSPSLSTTAGTNSPVGSYPIVASQGTLSDPNYSFSFANGTLTVTPTNAVLFSDNFERPTYPGNITPWVALQGAWLATNANFAGASDATNYSFAYLDADWTNYSVQAQVQFSVSNAYGGGLAGRLDPATGARYAAWIYPEQSPAGPALLRLIKFRDWTTWSATPMALVSLPAVGTNLHTLNLAFQDYQIGVSFDGVQLTNVTDSGFDSRPAYSTGAISADTYTLSSNTFIMSIANAQVTALPPLLLPLTVTVNGPESLPPGSNTVAAAYLCDGNHVGGTNSLMELVSVMAQTPSTVGMAAAEWHRNGHFPGHAGSTVPGSGGERPGSIRRLGERLDQHRRAGWAVDLHRIGGGPCPALLPLGQTISALWI